MNTRMDVENVYFRGLDTAHEYLARQARIGQLFLEAAISCLNTTFVAEPESRLLVPKSIVVDPSIHDGLSVFTLYSLVPGLPRGKKPFVTDCVSLTRLGDRHVLANLDGWKMAEVVPEQAGVLGVLARLGSPDG